MSSSKSHRRVTVEGSDEKRKPSVFERLGPGAPPRSTPAHEEEKCRHWVKYGHCRFGNTCKFKHPGRARSPDDLRHRVSRKREGSVSDSETEKPKDDSPRKSRKDKESKVKSTVVVTKPSVHDSDAPDSDSIDPANIDEEFDFDTTLKLIKKRQDLQKQLSLLEYEEQENDQDSFTKSRSDDEPDAVNIAPPQPIKHKKVAKPEDSSPPKKKGKDKKKKKKKSLGDSPEIEIEKKRPERVPMPVPPPPPPPPPLPPPLPKAKPKVVERKAKRSQSPGSRSTSRSVSRSPVRQKSPPSRKKSKEKRKRSMEKTPVPYESGSPYGKKPSPVSDKGRTTKKAPSPPPDPPPRKDTWHSPERKKVEKNPSPRESRSKKGTPPPAHVDYEEPPRRSRKSISPARSRPRRPASPSSRSKPQTSRGKKRSPGAKPTHRRSESSDSSSSSESSESSSSSDESVRRQASRDRRADKGDSYKREGRDARDKRHQKTDSTRKRPRESDDRSASARRARSPEDTHRDTDRGRGKSKRQVSSDRSPVKRRALSPSRSSRHEQSPLEVSTTVPSPVRGHDKSRRGLLSRERERSDSRSREERRPDRGDRPERERERERDREKEREREREVRREESPRTRPRDEAVSPGRAARERERTVREEYEAERARKIERSPDLTKRPPSPTQEQLRAHQRSGGVRALSPTDRRSREYREEYYAREAREAREPRDPRDPRIDERHLDPRYLESLRYSEQYRDREGRADPRLLAEYRDPYADPRRERYDPHALPPDPRYERDPRYDPRDPRYERDPRYAERALLERREELRLYRHADLARLPPEDLRALERRGYPTHPDELYAELSRTDRTTRRQQWEEFERRRALYDRKEAPRYENERLEREPRDLRDPREAQTLERWDPREEDLAREGRREWQREQEERERVAKKDMPSFGLAERYSRTGVPPKGGEAKAAGKGKRPLAKDTASEEGDRKRVRGEQPRVERGRDGKRRGEPGFSDWSEEDREQAAAAAEGDDRSRRAEEPHRDEAPEGRERDRRSPSRSSLGSRVSHRDKEHERLEERRRAEREREKDRDRREEDKAEDKDRSDTRGRDDDRGKRSDDRDDSYSRSGRTEADKDKDDKKLLSDHVSEAGSARGPRKDSLRSIDSFSSFDQHGGQGALPPITLEPAPESTTVPATTETAAEPKAKDVDGPAATAGETKPEASEQNEDAVNTETGDGQQGDLKDAYDDISDDDLGELIDNSEDKTENQDGKKAGIVDVLDIDWASMAKDTTAKEQVHRSALKRFTASNILASIGISKAYAGAELTKEIIEHCQRQMDEDCAGNGEENGDSKKLPVKEKFVLHSDIASLHACRRDRIRERAGLVRNIGPFRRALCARRDLYIRRKLCKLDGEHDLGDFTDQIVDQDFFKQAANLLKDTRV